MTNSTQKIQLFTVFTLVLFLLLVKNIANADEISDRHSKAQTAYWSGDVVGAIGHLKQLVESHDDTTPIQTKWLDLNRLLSSCVTINHANCVAENIEKLGNLIGESRDSKDREFYRADYLYYLGYLQLHYGGINEEDALKLLDSFKYNLANLGGIGLARGNLLAANVYLAGNKFNRARYHIDGAITALAAAKNITQFGFAKSLVETIDLLVATGDSLLATRIYYSTGNFIPHSLSGNVFELFQFRLIEANLLTLNNNVSGAKFAFDQAERLLGKLRLPPAVDKFFRSELYEGLTLYCIINNSDCVLESLAKHPYKTIVESGNYDEITNRANYLAYIFLHVISYSLHGLEIEQIILDTLDTTPLSSRVVLLNNKFQAFKIFAQGSARLKNDRDNGGSKIIEGVSLYLDLVIKFLADSPSAFPQIGDLEKFIISTGLSSLMQSQDALLTKKLALQIFELSNRTIRDEESRTIIDLANADNIDQRRKYHAYDRLKFNHNKMKLAAVNSQIARFAQSDFKPNLKEHIDFKTISLGVDFSSAKRRVLGSLNLGVSGESGKINEIPNISELQSMLGDDEAYLTIAFYFGKAFSLCVTKDTFDLQAKDILKGDISNVLALNNDLRIVYNSLRSTHPPSLSLDSQFPVKSSLKWYETILEGPLSCAKDKSHIIWSPHDAFLIVPLSVFLMEQPEKLGTGWDLVNAKWLGRKYAFTYASSAASFMASRKLRREKRGFLPFLGVGDPILSGKTIDDRVRETVSIPANYDNANAELFELYDLPETSSELKGISAVLGDSSVLYLRAKASERNLRREVLSRYNIIAFSTHGLIKDEITGLDEAALALTPSVTNLELYDGILKSSEIANLNISSDFVILSACNTDNFNVNDFSLEVQGVSTAFSFAGSPTTVASLWSIDSEISQSLITGLIEHYSNDSKRGISIALQKSINKHFEQLDNNAFAHPRFWAAYRVYGDGGLVSDNSSQHIDDNVNVINHYIGDNKDGGEATKFYKLNGDTLFVRGFEDKQENGRYRSFVAKLNTDLEIEWKHSHNKIANAGFLFKTNGGLILSGYETHDNQSKYLFYKIDSNGNFKWQKWMQDDGTGLFPVDGFLGRDKKNIAMFTQSRLSNPDNEDRSIIFYQIDDDGAMLLLESENIDEASEFDLRDTPKQFGVSDNVFYSFVYRKKHEQQELDIAYGYPKMCTLVETSLLYKFDKNSLKLVGKKLFSDLFVISLVELDDGRILGAGLVGELCEEKRDIVIFELNDDLTYTILFREQTPFFTRITELLVSSNKLFLIGRSDRIYDIRRFDDSNTKYYRPFDEMMDDIASYRLGDLFTFELDLNAKLLHKYWVQAGSDLYANDADLVDGRVSIFGAIDGEVSWYQLQ